MSCGLQCSLYTGHPASHMTIDCWEQVQVKDRYQTCQRYTLNTDTYSYYTLELKWIPFCILIDIVAYTLKVLQGCSLLKGYICNRNYSKCFNNLFSCRSEKLFFCVENLYLAYYSHMLYEFLWVSILTHLIQIGMKIWIFWIWCSELTQ